MEEEEIDFFLIFNSTNIFYLTGFSFIPTERPLVLIINQEEPIFFIPELELNHVNSQVPFVTEIFSYFDYPGDVHPTQQLADILKKELNASNKKITSESSSPPGYWGYKGPKIESVLNQPIDVNSDIIIDMRIIKEPEEIDLLKESSHWAGKAHEYLQKYTREGENEINVSIKASQEASKDLQKSLGKKHQPRGWTMFPAFSGYRGQIGKYSAFPHAMTQGFTFNKGDVLVTGATSNIYGYHSELERTMFIGEPSKRQEEIFNVMLKAQTTALNAVKPGLTCADIDIATRKVIKDEGYSNLLKHHTGHALGLEGHERPFLDIGDLTILKQGMVFSCEPGLYELGLGGFRHSDTFVVKEDGIEILTKYPRELMDLIIN
jgi:Xaa-Pro aminopeptidase